MGFMGAPGVYSSTNPAPVTPPAGTTGGFAKQADASTTYAQATVGKPTLTNLQEFSGTELGYQVGPQDYDSQDPNEQSQFDA